MKPFDNLDEVKDIVDQIASRLRRWRTVVVESQKLQPYE
jgi:predicted transcriptional regulator